MAHKKIDGNYIVDWATGDPERDRITLLSAYRDFIDEIHIIAQADRSNVAEEIINCFNKWAIDTENQIDDIPRIWIKRPK